MTDFLDEIYQASRPYFKIQDVKEFIDEIKSYGTSYVFYNLVQRNDGLRLESAVLLDDFIVDLTLSENRIDVFIVPFKQIVRVREISTKESLEIEFELGEKKHNVFHAYSKESIIRLKSFFGLFKAKFIKK